MTCLLAALEELNAACAKTDIITQMLSVPSYDEYWKAREEEKKCINKFDAALRELHTNFSQKLAA